MNFHSVISEFLSKFCVNLLKNENVEIKLKDFCVIADRAGLFFLKGRFKREKQNVVDFNVNIERKHIFLRLRLYTCIVYKH